MARPIEPTPVLEGKDAESFLKDLEKVKPTPLVREYLERCKRQYEAFQAKIVKSDGDKLC